MYSCRPVLFQEDQTREAGTYSRYLWKDGGTPASSGEALQRMPSTLLQAKNRGPFRDREVGGIRM